MSNQVVAESVTETIRRIVAEETCLPVEKVTLRSWLADLNVDSLDKVAIADAIELAFDVVIPDGELAHLETVADLVAVVERRVAARNRRV